MQIDVISDTVCPWCFIGKRRLETALAERPDIGFDVRWRPFQLDPTIPAEGRDRRAYLKAKFGDSPQFKAAGEAIKSFGDELGIPFAFDRIERTPNTADSHRLIRWASSVDRQDAVVEGLFNAYFVEGRDLGDRAVLCDVAGQAGMDSELVEELLASDADRDLVLKEIAIAQEMGVSGVPAFVIDNRFLLIGAQDKAVLLRAIDKAVELKKAEAGG
jgi:predicted DsbA family dithiol-disulfide isomerase